MAEVLEILKYTVPAIIVFLTAYLMIRSFLNNEFQRRHMEIRLNNQKYVLPIRLQAYERLTLFLERISPANLIPRVRKQDMSARDLQLALLSNIRNEFDHNLSQQLYVSPEAWYLVKNVKEEMITIVNRVGASLPVNATGVDLSKGIFNYFITHETVVPTQRALDFLKAEMKKIY